MSSSNPGIMEGGNNTKEQIFDVIVVGGGIMGSCTAYQTSKRGYSTLLLEQFDFLHNRGSSHGESRTLRLAYGKPHYSSMARESTKLWHLAQSEIGYKVLYPTNHLDIGPATDLEPVIRSCRSNSIEYRVVLDRAQMAQEFNGGVVIPEDWIGVVSRGAGVIKPTKAVCMFQTLALRNGAILKDNMEVVNISHDKMSNIITVYTSKGEKFYGKKCVITVGAWMSKLVKEVIGKEVPIQPLETTICYWKVKEEHQKEYSINEGFPTFSGHGSWPRIYGTPSLEYPGLIKVSVHGGPVCDPDKRTWAPTSEIVELLRGFVKERFGGRVEHEKPISTMCCMYSMTPDKDYVVDFLGGEFGKDVVVAGGFSGDGFKMSPLIGKVVADLVVDGVAQGIELEHFKLARFKEDNNGLSIPSVITKYNT